MFRPALLCVGFCLSLQAQPYDLIIENGRIMDGSGNPWFYGDVGIRGDAIAAVGKLEGSPAKSRIDAKGLIVSPGFIDIHNHGRRGIFEVPSAENWIRQGVTTIIEGPDGSSPVPLRPFLEKLSRSPLGINIGSMIGQGSIRQTVMGTVNRPATPAEIDRMRALAVQGMKDGAFGLSTGLFYVPGNFTPTEEIIAIARAVAPLGAIHVSHMRNEAEDIVNSVRETIRIGEEGGLPTQITHHKVIGKKYWGASRQTLELVEQARARGVDVTIDQYPYTASSTGIAALLPQWSLEGGAGALKERLAAPGQRQKIEAVIVQRILEDRGGGDPKNVQLASCAFDSSLAGKTLADLERERKLEPDARNAASIVIELMEKGGCSAVYHAIDEQDIVPILRSPFSMIASDGEIPVFGKEAPHPRSYGTFPRVLGRYVREQKAIGWEEAIRKMSGFPAARLSLWRRGLLRPGFQADVTVFDPAEITDLADFQTPHRYAAGVRHVIVRGEAVLRDGTMTGKLPGQVLYGPGRQ